MNGLPRHGEVWWCELERTGARPAVVLSRDATIPRLRRVMVAPCTTNIRGLPTEVVLDPDHDPVPKMSAANLDSVESVSVDALVDRLGTLGFERRSDICAALEIAVDCQR